MNVVLDTNVLVSAILWLGPSNRILRLAERRILKLCMNEFLLRELFEVLHRPKFKRRVAKLNSSPPEITVKILQMAKIFPDMGILRVVEEDPDDNWVISCALASESKYIITGDSHLLKIGGFHDIAILKPQQFLSRLKI